MRLSFSKRDTFQQNNKHLHSIAHHSTILGIKSMQFANLED